MPRRRVAPHRRAAGGLRDSGRARWCLAPYELRIGRRLRILYRLSFYAFYNSTGVNYMQIDVQLLDGNFITILSRSSSAVSWPSGPGAIGRVDRPIAILWRLDGPTFAAMRILTRLGNAKIARRAISSGIASTPLLIASLRLSSQIGLLFATSFCKYPHRE